MAVHFQRVEIVIAGALGFSLVTAENLRLVFGIQSAQLVAHPLDGRFHLAKGEADVADLLLDSTAEDRCFARQVDQTLQQFCGNLDQLLRCPPRSGFLGGQLCASNRSEEHTSELQSLMRISYAVFCLNKKNETIIF